MFNRRLHLLTFSGIKIGIDLSWIFIAFLLSWTLATDYFPQVDPNLSYGTYWLMGTLGMLGLFTCIILHELGHALVAKHYKIPISHITLFLFGGVAEIKEEPKSPKVEFLVAIAGPLVSLFLVGFLAACGTVAKRLEWPLLVVAVSNYLAFVNMALIIFNLVPAFPLDGGRIFRAALWAWKKDLAFATRVASRVGAAFGILLILFALLCFFTGNFISGFWFLMLGFFLQQSASGSQVRFHLKQELHGAKVAQFMKKNPTSVQKGTDIASFIKDYIYTSHHQLYPVLDKEVLIGTVGLKEIRDFPEDQWRETLVETVMTPRKEFHTVTQEEGVLKALHLMEEDGVPIVLVVENERLVGLLTAQDLFKIISIKTGLKKS